MEIKMLSQVFEGEMFSSNIKNCYVTEKIPGKIIVEHLGTVHSIIEPSHRLVEGYNIVKRNPIQVVLELLYQEALKHGANAVVNIRIITGSYGGGVPYIIAYGDAVVLKDTLEEKEILKTIKRV